MGLNTYPSNPFPPSTDRMDADVLEAEVNKLESDVDQLKSGLTNVQSDVKLNTQDLTTPSRSINLMTLPITITKSGSSTGTVTNNDGVITLNGEFFNEEVITVTCADCIAPNDAIIAYMNNVALTNANISFYNGSTKHDYFSFSIPNRIIYTSALANVVGKTINRYDITFTGTTTLDNFTFSLMMVHNGQNVSTYTPYIPSVESRIEAVESDIARNTGTFALGENVTAIRSSLTKSACVCELCGLYQKTLTLDSWNKIGDLPNGYKPVAESRFLAQNNTLSKWMLGKMDTEGGVYVYPTADDSQAASTNVLIHQLYMA